MRLILGPLLASALCLAAASDISPRQYCGSDYEICVAEGANSASPPSIGPDMRELFVKMVESVDVTNPWKREIVQRGDIVARDELPSLCCKSGMECQLLKDYKIPFCWDRFTTNFYFVDGSYGSILTGLYNTSHDVVNLVSGDYTRSNGESGNIYEGHDFSKPNTSTMVLPPAWTSKGVGSAIPGSELGEGATYTTVISGTVKEPIIIPASTVAATTVSGSVIPGTTFPATTIPGTRITPTTLTTSGRGSAETEAPSKGAGSVMASIPRGFGRIAWCIVMFAASLLS
ncbi:hypothetical protein AJ79_09774 [Helicocarpus griseus UAMH5409]|uniref:Uncharacterized protein n=1 Tax=Helicocarpus griseus UAMH5409 TaxID=1447875 RepID=A0A2B7WHL0_9EURO|nr:hypothetical protein AJ79_09774 [Helicocarpus griseus UAMH5409]